MLNCIFLKQIIINYNNKLTVANFSISSSDAPKEAKPSSCENWANTGSTLDEHEIATKKTKEKEIN